MEKITLEKKEKLDFRASEAYKSLRTNLQFCGSEIKVIALTSCTPNEGKTSVAFYLAESLAESGKKVLFIDADLRKSVLVGRYGVGKINGGLTEYLAGQRETEQVIYQTEIDGMYMLFSGAIAPNPSELLGNHRFEALLQSAREQYEYIIIDTPPLGSVIDSAVVAQFVDGVIMVIANNTISYKFAQNVKKQLEKSNVKILGAVLNKVPMEKKGYGNYYGNYYGYGKYYGDYGNYGSKEAKVEG